MLEADESHRQAEIKSTKRVLHTIRVHTYSTEYGGRYVTYCSGTWMRGGEGLESGITCLKVLLS